MQFWIIIVSSTADSTFWKPPNSRSGLPYFPSCGDTR